MIAPARRVVGLVFLVLCGSAAASEPVPREELAKRGKAATAYVELSARAGTAFCLHASGLFITNEHVTHDAGSREITLVLHPGETTERVLHAKVIRQDAQLDLALLRVEGSETFTPLRLGSNEDVTELMDVVTLGFPFGRAFAGRRQQYPSISVNVHHVSSLRRDEGELDRIQLDSGLNPGNSGGPVLDQQGRVVGLIQAGVFGGNLNFAIPVGQIQRFLARPDIRFAPPEITVADLSRPATFEATIVPLLPAKDPLNVELSLRAGDQPERRYPMEASGQTYRATAVPLPAAGPGRLRLTISYGTDSVSGTVVDRSFRVGKREITFAEVRDLHPGAKGEATLRDGNHVEGAISGLDDVPVRLGDMEVRFDLGKASEARIEPPATVDAVSCAIVVRGGGKEVARASETIFVKGAVSVAAADRASVAAPPLTGTQPIVKPLPASVADLVIGGNGRYLIMHLPKVGKLAVFDTVQRRMQYVSLPDDNVKIAAGMEKLIVVLPNENLVQRWNLADLKRETSAAVNLKGMIKAACMGCASNGPLLMHVASGDRFGMQRTPPFVLLSVQTLKPLEAEINVQTMSIIMGPEGLRLRASPDGSVFGVWQSRSSPQGLGVMVHTGSELKARYEHTSPVFIVPGADGKVLYTGIGRFTSELKSMEDTPVSNQRVWMLPAIGGDYYMTVKSPHQDRQPAFSPGVHQQVEEKATLSFQLIGESRALATLTDIPVVQQPQWGQSEGLSPDQRLLFLPAAKMLVSIPLSDDRLILRPFDIDEAMERSGVDYLLVTSRPPTKAFKGGTFNYQIKVKSRKGGLKYSLESGPAGMTVSETGKVTWPVPTEPTEDDVTVIVNIRNAAGQERFHTFTLSVRD